MNYELKKNNLINNLLDIAIKEDIGDGDHTSLATIPKEKTGKAKLLVKQDGIIAGIDIAEYIFSKIDKNLKMEKILSDGDKVKAGDIAFYVEGKVITLLQAERLVLNFMQRMSGIATNTNKYVKQIQKYKTKVLDTRKTTPGLRLIEKEAVRLGGGTNYRIGLYDLIMIKDNHVDFSGGIRNAIAKTLKYLRDNNKNLKITIEVRSLEDVQEVLETGNVNRIMLDNFDIENTKRAVELINGKYEIESSGGITLDTIENYAKCGVDFVSVGALTHQIKSLDLSLKAV